MKTVMLVDDDEYVLDALAEILGRSGYSVLLKQEGLPALAASQGSAPIDCIILDYHMPGMDGPELLASIRRDAPHIPVIMLTGYGDIESYLKAVGLGVSEYLDKPVRAGELRRVVWSAIDAGAPSRTESLK